MKLEINLRCGKIKKEDFTKEELIWLLLKYNNVANEFMDLPTLTDNEIRVLVCLLFGNDLGELGIAKSNLHTLRQKMISKEILDQNGNVRDLFRRSIEDILKYENITFVLHVARSDHRYGDQTVEGEEIT